MADTEDEKNINQDNAEPETTTSDDQDSQQKPEASLNEPDQPELVQEEELQSISDSDPVLVEKVQLNSLVPDEIKGKKGIKMDLLMNLALNVSIELGRTEMLIKDVLKLDIGSIVELNKMAGEPIDLLINNKPFAEGEVVVVDENFGVRITNLLISDSETGKISDAISKRKNNI